VSIGLIVHGGAGLLAGNHHEAVLAGCRAATEAGRAVLTAGRSALDAVEAAVRVLEDNPLFNAGYGSVLNRDGLVEMDALIMEGGQPRIGAVAMVHRVKNPISLARLVMERTEHHLLAGEGADQFAAEQGFSLVDPKSMIAPNRLTEFEAQGSDTVGAVALDSSGSLAVAVSTGGLRRKLPGRVGDSPIAGAGAYADNALGAACATGVGEGIIRSLLTFRAVEAIGTPESPDAQSAADSAIRIFTDRFNGDGGLIVIDRQGRIGIAHNSPFLPVAWFQDDRPIYAQTAVSR